MGNPLLGFNYEAHIAPAYQTSAQSGSAWVDDSTNFPAHFSRRPLHPEDLRDVYQIWGGHKPVVVLNNLCLVFRHIAKAILNLWRMKGDWDRKSRPEFRNVILCRGRRNVWVNFSCQTWTLPVIYFWPGGMLHSLGD